MLPLPEPARSVVYNEAKGYSFDAYTAEQMHAYAAAAVAAERERLCAAIKSADDKSADDKSSEGDYMLDSDDCISVIRGTWNPEGAA